MIRAFKNPPPNVNKNFTALAVILGISAENLGSWSAILDFLCAGSNQGILNKIQNFDYNNYNSEMHASTGAYLN